MKRWAAVITALALGAALVSCSEEGVSSDSAKETQGSQSVTQTAEEDTQSVTTSSQTDNVVKSIKFKK